MDKSRNIGILTFIMVALTLAVLLTASFGMKLYIAHGIVVAEGGGFGGDSAGDSAGDSGTSSEGGSSGSSHDTKSSSKTTGDNSYNDRPNDNIGKSFSAWWASIFGGVHNNDTKTITTNHTANGLKPSITNDKTVVDFNNPNIITLVHDNDTEP